MTAFLSVGMLAHWLIMENAQKLFGCIFYLGCILQKWANQKKMFSNSKKNATLELVVPYWSKSHWCDIVDGYESYLITEKYIFLCSQD